MIAALLPNYRFGGECPLPRLYQGTRSISTMPRALKRFMSATRVCISAVWRSGSREAILSPNDVRHRILASIRLRASEPDHRFQIANPRRCVAAGCRFGPWLPGRPLSSGGHSCDRNDRRAATLKDRGMAAPGVESPVAGHGADLLVWRELVQKVRRGASTADFAGLYRLSGRPTSRRDLTIFPSAWVHMTARAMRSIWRSS